MVGLAGESQNFDGNGHYVRFAVGGGDQTISTGKYGGAPGAKLYGRVNDPPLGTRPAYPGKRPPYNCTAVQGPEAPDSTAPRRLPGRRRHDADPTPVAAGRRVDHDAAGDARPLRGSLTRARRPPQPLPEGDGK